ncbi:hypothetical protein [Halopiger djelfimassiliensis]|uniref:hypothetical protein n=1 Tax=Halopiger djelfimassiliensis TaxID=1293047 RepID=UPI000677E137|nr:hypothetical protein [Halopiger djelfimassiliensis]
MKRRAAITATGVALSALGGCLLESDSTTSNGNETDSEPTDDESSEPVDLELAGYPPAEYDCGDRTRPPADQDPSSEDAPPLEYPSIPSSLSDTSVTEYASKFERAYMRNKLVKKYGDRLLSSPGSSSGTVLATDLEGYYVEVDYYMSYSVASEDGEEVSDGPQSLSVYYITPEAVFRDRRTGGPNEDLLARIDLSRRDSLVACSA